jgi:hypothetical protein
LAILSFSSASPARTCPLKGLSDGLLGSAGRRGGCGGQTWLARRRRVNSGANPSRGAMQDSRSVLDYSPPSREIREKWERRGVDSCSCHPSPVRAGGAAVIPIAGEALPYRLAATSPIGLLRVGDAFVSLALPGGQHCLRMIRDGHKRGVLVEPTRFALNGRPWLRWRRRQRRSRTTWLRG